MNPDPQRVEAVFAAALRLPPEADRPAQAPLDPDYDPWAGYEWPDRAGQLERAPRKRS